jgi:hypothetical protein
MITLIMNPISKLRCIRIFLFFAEKIIKKLYPLDDVRDWFEGQMENGFPIRGKLVFKDLSSYEGSFSNGIYDGRGILNSTNGNVYTGEFVEGVMNGKGIMEYGPTDSLNRIRYEGEWKHNQFEGSGLLIFKNGTSYDGKFKNSLYNGFGKYFGNNNENYTGHYMNGQKEGVGSIATYSNATFFSEVTGIFKGDEFKQGFFISNSGDLRTESEGTFEGFKPVSGNLTLHNGTENGFISIENGKVVHLKRLDPQPPIDNTSDIKHPIFNENWSNNEVETFLIDTPFGPANVTYRELNNRKYYTLEVAASANSPASAKSMLKLEDGMILKVNYYKENELTRNGSLEYTWPNGKNSIKLDIVDGVVGGPAHFEVNPKVLEAIVAEGIDGPAKFYLEDEKQVGGVFEGGTLREGFIITKSGCKISGKFDEGWFTGNVSGPADGCGLL